MTESPGPEYNGFRMTTLTAFTQVDPADDQEGLVAFWSSSMNSWIPMVAADPKHEEGMRERAQDIANATGRSIKVSRFTVREDIDVIEPSEVREDAPTIVLVEAVDDGQ